MIRFKDAIIEYRYFDQNGDQVHDKDLTQIVIARTDGQDFGAYWHALHPRQRHRIGQAKTIEEAVKIGSIQTISDNAATVSIRLERGDLGPDGRRYNRRVFVDGVHIATFKPSPLFAEYYLVDGAGEAVYVQDIHRRIGAEVSNQAGMVHLVRQWLELIPDEHEIEERRRKRIKKEQREAAEAAEAKRIFVIQRHAVEMFELLMKIYNDVDNEVNLHQTQAIEKLRETMERELNDE